MRKLLIACSLLPLWLAAQENAPIIVNKRVLNRLYMNVMNDMARQLFDNGRNGRLVLYKDFKNNAAEKPMDAETFMKAGNYKVKEQLQDPTRGTVDTTITIHKEWNWLWGYRRMSADVFCVYYQKPTDDTTGRGEVLGYCLATDLKNLLGEYQWDFLQKHTAGGKLLDRQTLVNRKWQLFNFRSELWNVPSLGKLATYSLPDFKTKYSTKELDEMFKQPRIVTVIQDSAHREYDYQKVEYDPFNPDSINGFGFSMRIVSDPVSNQQRVVLDAFGPAWDASQLGGNMPMSDPMYWMRWAEFQKNLGTESLAFINEIVFLAVSERLNSECNY